MAQNLPYQHPSVSELAKALRKSIQISHDVDIGQTNMLQLLAKAAGFQNFQSYKAHGESVGERLPQKTTPLIHPKFDRSIGEMRESFRKRSSIMTPDIDSHLRTQITDLSREFVNPLSALRYAQDYLSSVLSMPRFLSRYSVAYIEMRVFLPYTFEAIKDKEDTFIILGRDYKPLGMPQKKDHVEYENYPNLHIKIPVDELEAATFNFRYSPRYLYSTGPYVSRKDAQNYLEQLNRVVELVERHYQS